MNIALSRSGATARLARHIADCPAAAIPDAALEAARRSLIDALGVSIAATRLGDGVAAFLDLAGQDGAGAHAVIGRPNARAPLLSACLANGALAHAIDFEDVYDAAPAHPNASVVPVVLALAEAQPDVTGADMLAAIAIGADITCRLAEALEHSPEALGWYTPSILGAMGAAAAAARMLRLNAQETVSALSLTFGAATTSAEFKHTKGSMLRAVRDGFAAEAGVRAALLAQRGLIGFDQVLEGKMGFFAQYAQGRWNPERLFEGLGASFLGARVTYKPWPSCRGTHAPIEAALQLRSDIGADEIRSIEVEGSPFLSILFEPRAAKLAPELAIEAKFSIPYMTAFAWLRGAPEVDSPKSSDLNDAAILSLAEKVRHTPTTDSAPADAATLVVTTHDGRVLTREIKHALGHPDRPLSADALKTKFRTCAASGVHPPSEAAINAFFAATEAMTAPRAPRPQSFIRMLQEPDHQ